MPARTKVQLPRSSSRRNSRSKVAGIHAAATTGTLTPSPSLADQKTILLEHYRAIRAYFGEGPGVRLGRKHVSWYSHGLHGSAAFRAQMNRLDNGAAVEQLIHDFYDPLIRTGFVRQDEVALAA